LHILGEDRRVRVRPPLFVIGSRESADLRLEDPAIAASHAILLSVDGEWILRHVGGDAITLLNGEPVDQALPRSGDVVTIGSIRARILIGHDTVLDAPPGDTLSAATRDWGSLTRALTFVEESRATLPNRSPLPPPRMSIWKKLLGRA
jgi:pSer/pThr/pTyr-binding forkhead associated (FHA) protein